MQWCYNRKVSSANTQTFTKLTAFASGTASFSSDVNCSYAFTLAGRLLNAVILFPCLFFPVRHLLDVGRFTEIYFSSFRHPSAKKTEIWYAVSGFPYESWLYNRTAGSARIMSTTTMSAQPLVGDFLLLLITYYCLWGTLIGYICQSNPIPWHPLLICPSVDGMNETTRYNNWHDLYSEGTLRCFRSYLDTKIWQKLR